MDIDSDRLIRAGAQVLSSATFRMNSMASIVTLLAFIWVLFGAPSGEVQIKWFWLTLLVAFWLLLIVLQLSWLAAEHRKASLDVVRVAERDDKYEILCRPDDRVQHQTLISAFEEIDGFEVLVGQGYVNSINSKGMIQIAVTRYPAEKREWWNSKVQQPNALGDFLVLPVATVEGVFPDD